MSNVEQAKKFLIIGQGAIGLPVANQLASQGLAVAGMARGAKENYKHHEKVQFIQADASTVTASELLEFHSILIIVAPSMSNLPQPIDTTLAEVIADRYQSSYQAVTHNIANLSSQLVNLERLVFISSTGVYGQNNGEWLDEHSLPQPPTSTGAKIVLKAEQMLQQEFADKVVIIRPSGIYGIDRLMRVRKAQEENKAPMAEFAWTNRIMDTDLIEIICQVMVTEQPKPIYIATDYQLVTSYVLTHWLCQQLHSELPTIEDNDKDKITGKRLHSNIPLSWLKYPDWQSGYQMILGN